MRRVAYKTIHGELMIRHGRIEVFADFYLFTPSGYKLPIKITEDRLISNEEIIIKRDEPT